MGAAVLRPQHFDVSQFLALGVGEAKFLALFGIWFFGNVLILNI